mgnify:CR=1 FL=1
MTQRILLLLVLSGCAQSTAPCALPDAGFASDDSSAIESDAGPPATDAAMMPDARDAPQGGAIVLCALANRVSLELLDPEGGACGPIVCPWTIEAHCDPQISQRCALALLQQADSCTNFWLIWAGDCLPSCDGI